MRRLGEVAIGSLLLLFAAEAAADGERTPIIGAAVMGGPTTQDHMGVIGVGVEGAWWFGRVGLAAEASGRWGVDGQGSRAAVLGASLRLRLLDALTPSLLEPSDVELGIELHGIIERTWWGGLDSDVEPVSHGLGLALRLRGSGDEDSSRLIAESRFFLRVMAARPISDDGVLARTMTPTPTPRPDEPPEVTILVGVGASFGSGDRGYLERFRRRAPFEWD